MRLLRLQASLVFASLAGLLGAPCARAQTPAASAPPTIQDNSFLIEEAYNQEAGVVQTIQEYVRTSGTGDWVYSLTQEWPVPDQKNQLSFTLQLLGLSGSEGGAKGFGDLLLNYRYQLVGNSEAPVAVAPRATVVLPSGDYKRGLGAGGVGLQVALPLSLVLSRLLVTHTNVGGTVVFSAKSAEGTTADLWSSSLGQSVVWLAHPNVNLLVEALALRSRVFGADGAPTYQTSALVSPGVRAALNLPHDLQIVGGIAVPIGLGPAAGQRSLFLYFSVELPVWKPKA